MKPKVSFIRKTTLLKNISIVQLRQDQTTRNFNDRGELVSYLNQIVPQPDVDTVMYVRCGCYRDFIFKDISDIPQSDVNCVCSQRVIKYG